MQSTFFGSVRGPLAIRQPIQAKPIRAHSLVVKANYVTAANVEVDVQMPFEGAMRSFKRDANTVGVVPEMKRRRYNEDGVTMRKRRERERRNKLKSEKFGVQTFEDRNPMLGQAFFAQDYGTMEFTGRRRSTSGINYRSGSAPTEGNTSSDASMMNAAGEGGFNGQRTPRAPRRENAYTKVTKSVEIDGKLLGRVIGYKGATIKAMGEKTATKMWFAEVEGTERRVVNMTGEPEAVAAAEALLAKVVAEGARANGLPDAPEGEERPRRTPRKEEVSA